MVAKCTGGYYCKLANKMLRKITVRWWVVSTASGVIIPVVIQES